MNKMKFKLHLDAVNYFKSMKKIPKDWKKWHTYYICLMVGFENQSLSNRTLDQKTEFYETFPEEFRSHQPKIIAKLIHSELIRKGRNLNDSSLDPRIMKDVMLNLLDHKNDKRITNEAIDLMNMYADEGFKTIKREIIKTDNFQSFLFSYYEKYMKDQN